MAALLVVIVHTSFASGFTLRSPLGDYPAPGDSGVSVSSSAACCYAGARNSSCRPEAAQAFIPPASSTMSV